MRYTQEQLEARFGEASERIREVITSPEVAEQIDALRKKYDLHIDDAGVLMDEVGYVLLGLTPPDQFISALKKALDLPDADVESVASEINTIVFEPIHTELVQPKKQTEPRVPEEAPESEPEREALLKEIETEDTAPTKTDIPPSEAQKEPEEPIQKKPNTEKPDIPAELPTQQKNDLAKAKLGGSVSLPKETTREVVSSQNPSTDSKTETGGTSDSTEIPIEKKPYGGRDPYREPITETDLRSDRQ